MTPATSHTQTGANPGSDMAETNPQSASSPAAPAVSVLIARARKAQAAIAKYTQTQLDELVTASHPIENWVEDVHELEAGAVARGVLTF